MRESVKLYAADPEGNEVSLEFEYSDDSVGLLVDGAEVCGLDWTDNLRLALERMLEMWAEPERDTEEPTP